MRRKTGVLLVWMLLGGVLYLTGSLFWEYQKEEAVYQDIVSLNGIEYNESLLKEAEKISGIRSLTPMIELNVRLKIGDYTMDATLLGVDFEEFSFKGRTLEEIQVGSAPVLLLGEKALAALTDQNGHTISKDQQKKYLEDYEDMELFYRLDSASEAGQWLPCKVAGVLTSPSEGIYLPYAQVQSLASANGQKVSVEKVLLTIQGTTNREKALRYF